MRHHNSIRAFGRVRSQRRALLRSLARSLILRGKIETTEAKAKEVRPFVEKLVSAGRIDTVASRRLVSTRLGSAPDAVTRLFAHVSPRYKERKGGYTRITKRGKDGSGKSRALIEFV